MKYPSISVSRKKRYSDREAKAELRRWPVKTSLWSHGAQPEWIRAQPKPEEKKAQNSPIHPRLVVPGVGAFRAQPDGLWVHFVVESAEAAPLFVDCIVFEVCGSRQNLADKRSRFSPKLQALMLEVDRDWAEGEIDREKSSRPRNDYIKASWDRTRTLVPIRHLRVAYFLPDDESDIGFMKLARMLPLEAHEYLLPQDQLAQYTNPTLQAFLRQMAPNHNVYPKGRMKRTGARGVATDPYLDEREGN